MKVRHKQNGTLIPTQQYEVVGNCHDYYICKDPNIGPLVALPAEDYEPVPSETWRDVTGECIDNLIPANGYAILAHRLEMRGLRDVARVLPPYRLRKVQLFKEANAALNLGQHLHPTQWAFIVEKRDP